MTKLKIATKSKIATKFKVVAKFKIVTVSEMWGKNGTKLL